MIEKQMINILLVEDDEVDVMNAKRAFKENNITNPLCPIQNGLEALIMLRGEEKTKNIPGDRKLTLLNLNMPKINKIEISRELRTTLIQHIPVVVLDTSNIELELLI